MNAVSLYVTDWASSNESIEERLNGLIETFTKSYGYAPPKEWVRVGMDGDALYIQIRDFSNEDTDKPVWDALDNLEKAIQTVKYFEDTKKRLPDLLTQIPEDMTDTQRAKLEELQEQSQLLNTGATK